MCLDWGLRRLKRCDLAERIAYEYPFHVGLSSTDRAGILFYPELFRHAHDAYEAFMASLGEDLAKIFERDHPLIPVANAKADYLKPLRHGDRVIMRLRVERVGRSSITLSYDFIGPAGNVCARAQSVHVCVDRGSGEPVPVPDELRDKLERFI